MINFNKEVISLVFTDWMSWIPSLGTPGKCLKTIPRFEPSLVSLIGNLGAVGSCARKKLKLIGPRA